MSKPQVTWQGIGISSNPFQKDEPLSVRLQSYLEEAASSGDEHIIVIGDLMQVDNYTAIHGLDESRARRIAERKGISRKKSLERILKARGIRNVRVQRFDEIINDEYRTTIARVDALFNSDLEVRNAVLKCVPKRLLDRSNSIDKIVQYAITEIGLILSIDGVKFGHDRERPYDDAALLIHDKYGIGRKPSFTYSTLGLEFVPHVGYTEPYSSQVSPNRLLLTDKRSGFIGKILRLDTNNSKKVKKELKMDGLLEDEQLHSFHSRRIEPTRRALARPRIIRNIAASVAASIISLASAVGYASHDIESIRQDSIRRNVGIFALNGPIETFNMAYKQAMDDANSKVHDKYGISNFFSTEGVK